MDFTTAVKTVVTQKYADFNGRAPRSEYWWFYLAFFIAYLAAYVIAIIIGTIGFILVAIVGLGLLVPLMAVTVRRLHDVDKSGWWILISFVPLVGGFILLYFTVIKGTEGPNRFGPDPFEHLTLPGTFD